MEKKKPTIGQIQEYLKRYNPLGLSGASISLINEHNHLHYRLEKDDKVFCLRMINPESYRRGEWLHIPEEYTLLKHLEFTGLGPRPYFVDPERFILPLLIQEFVADVICFNDLKPLSKEHLVATAQTIALLNAQRITPDNFPFRKRFTRYSYLTSVKNWRERLDVTKKLAMIKKPSQKDVLEWADKIEKLVNQAEKILEGFEPLLEKATWTFNFDGAHCGNTYWEKKQETVIFLDWQKISYGDPSFTLARFLTSVGEKGKIPSQAKKTMVQAYTNSPYYFRVVKQTPQVPDFVQLVDQRLFERQIADLVWVLWNYIKEKKTDPVEKTTSVRYQAVKKLIE